MTVPVPSPADHGDTIARALAYYSAGLGPSADLLEQGIAAKKALVAQAEASARLLEALRTYGRHSAQCQAYAAGRIQVEVCTCGLAAVEYS